MFLVFTLQHQTHPSPKPSSGLILCATSLGACDPGAWPFPGPSLTATSPRAVHSQWACLCLFRLTPQPCPFLWPRPAPASRGALGMLCSFHSLSGQKALLAMTVQVKEPFFRRLQASGFCPSTVHLVRVPWSWCGCRLSSGPVPAYPWYACTASV